MRKLMAVAFLVGVFSGVAQADVGKLPNFSPTVIDELYNPSGNVVAGNTIGNVTVVEFFNYNCSYCRKAYPAILELLRKDHNVRLIYKEDSIFQSDLDLPNYAALAAAKQGKYLAMHEALMTSTKPLSMDELINIAKNLNLNIDQFKKDMTSPQIKQILDSNDALAKTIGLDGVPVVIVAPTRVLGSKKVLKQYMIDDDITYKVLNKLVGKSENEF